MREFKAKVKDSTNKYEVGTLLKPHNTIAQEKHGLLIVLDYKNQGIPVYVLYSQKQQCEWELKAWVANAFYNVEAEGSGITELVPRS